jgi:hypothetical protein
MLEREGAICEGRRGGAGRGPELVGGRRVAGAGRRWARPGGGAGPAPGRGSDRVGHVEEDVADAEALGEVLA